MTFPVLNISALLNPLLNPFLLQQVYYQQHYKPQASPSSWVNVLFLVVLTALTGWIVYKFIILEIMRRWESHAPLQEMVEGQQREIFKLRLERSLRDEVKQELFEAHRQGALGKGFQDAAMMLPNFYDKLMQASNDQQERFLKYIEQATVNQHKYDNLLEAGAGTRDALATAQHNKQIALKNADTLLKQTKKAERERDQYKEELDRLREQAAERLENFEEQVEEQVPGVPQKVHKASSKASSGFSKGSQKVHKASSEASSNVRPLLSEEALGSFMKLSGGFEGDNPQERGIPQGSEPEKPSTPGQLRMVLPYNEDAIYNYEPNEDYEMKERMFKGRWLGMMDIIRKLDGKHVGMFDPAKLSRGETYFIEGISRYVVLCGLPSCYTVKITSQPATRCCCKNHANQLAKIEREEIKVGS